MKIGSVIKPEKYRELLALPYETHKAAKGACAALLLVSATTVDDPVLTAYPSPFLERLLCFAASQNAQFCPGANIKVQRRASGAVKVTINNPNPVV